MKRTEPPQLATWILDHGIPGERDEALAGDLLEEFHSGRSQGWYWRQALAAWLSGWLKYLSVRRSLLLFAALWSVSAPGWDVIVGHIDPFNPNVTLGPLFRMFCLWVALNLAFVFAGMLLFVLVHTRIAGRFSPGALARAFMLAPLVFLPMYFATFALMNLFAYPGFNVDRAAFSPLREMATFTLRANALRLPYFLTILWSLWSATPLLRALSVSALEFRPSKPAPRFAIPAAPLTRLDSYSAKRFLVLMIGAGLLNALIAGFLVCRLPAAHMPTLTSLIVRASIYVAGGALAGIVGIYLYWHNPSSQFRAAPPLPFSLFALASAAGWVWVPSMVIFSEQLSAATALVGAIGASLLAANLRHATSAAFAPPPALETEEYELFAESLYRPPRQAHGYVIAICLYAAGWALATRSNYTACALLALAASLFAWNRTFAPADNLDTHREYKRAALRLALVFLPAVLVTIWALLDGVAHRNSLAAVNAARAGEASAAEDARQSKSQAAGHGFSGYQSLILWPTPPKKQIVAPLPPLTNFLAPGTTKPLVIHFSGQYWYFQPPNHGPSPNAYQAHGTPLAVDIHTTNFISLVMEAHQTLGAPIRTARLRQIQVTLLDRDNRPGVINLAVLLSNSAAPGNQLYLDEQPIPSSLPASFSIKSAPATDTLNFSIPDAPKLRTFDQITLMFFPDPANNEKGPQVAIDQFQLQPR